MTLCLGQTSMADLSAAPILRGWRTSRDGQLARLRVAMEANLTTTLLFLSGLESQARRTVSQRVFVALCNNENYLNCRHCCGDLLVHPPHKTTDKVSRPLIAAKPEWGFVKP